MSDTQRLVEFENLIWSCLVSRVGCKEEHGDARSRFDVYNDDTKTCDISEDIRRACRFLWRTSFTLAPANKCPQPQHLPHPSAQAHSSTSFRKVPSTFRNRLHSMQHRTFPYLIHP